VQRDRRLRSVGAEMGFAGMLEEIGQAEARASEGAKKLFAITPAGVAHLNENRAEAEAALARLDALARKDEALDTGPVAPWGTGLLRCFSPPAPTLRVPRPCN